MHTCYFSLLILGFYFLNEALSVSSPSSPLSAEPFHTCLLMSAQGMHGFGCLSPCFGLFCPHLLLTQRGYRLTHNILSACSLTVVFLLIPASVGRMLGSLKKPVMEPIIKTGSSLFFPMSIQIPRQDFATSFWLLWFSC